VLNVGQGLHKVRQHILGWYILEVGPLLLDEIAREMICMSICFERSWKTGFLAGAILL